MLPALAHREDARGVVAGAVQQAVEPALEGQGDALPLAQGEDASGVVAHAVQEVVDAAGAGLLPAAVGQALPGGSQGAEQEQQQEAGSSPGLPVQRASLEQGSYRAERGGLHSPRTVPSAVLTGVSIPPCPGCCRRGPAPHPVHLEHHPVGHGGSTLTCVPTSSHMWCPHCTPALLLWQTPFPRCPLTQDKQ